MRILFGPEHDGLHIDPSEPNGYEWWYFDAISDDERYVLVVIFFLGTPMSPYYKAVVDGKNPLPKDWCGVFVSLHERTKNGYKERAYAYNLYTYDMGFDDTVRQPNSFRDAPLRIRLGNSTVSGSYSHDGRRFNHSWLIELNERNLWFGATKANLTFMSSLLLDGKPPIESNDEGHNWVCVAPDCQVVGDITLAGETIRFTGRGYHDHNFGQLPWTKTREWFWGRVLYPSGSPKNGSVYYASWKNTEQDTRQAANVFVASWDEARSFRYSTSARVEPVRTKSGYPIVPKGYDIVEDEATSEHTLWLSHFLQHAPFYRRFRLGAWVGEGDRPYSIGIGEIFQPARLCGPIISRMMWTRIRRRS